MQNIEIIITAKKLNIFRKGGFKNISLIERASAIIINTSAFRPRRYQGLLLKKNHHKKYSIANKLISNKKSWLDEEVSLTQNFLIDFMESEMNRIDICIKAVIFNMVINRFPDSCTYKFQNINNLSE